MRITVIFNRLGPYHVARLNALASRADLTVIELTGMDQTYAWDKVEDGVRFKRVTLFESLTSESDRKRLLPTALRAALDAAQPQAVAAPGWGFLECLVALDWCRVRRVPAVLMTESQARDHARSARKELVKSLIVAQYRAGLVGGQSSTDYAASLGLPRERIFPGYDVVDNRHFQTGADQARADAGLRQSLGLPQRYWLASCRFVPQKNLAMLLRAFARYQAQATGGAVDLVLLGDGPLKTELEAQRRSLGLESALRMPGFAQYPALPSYYGLAEAFVHVSSIEPWGLVINEAMAAGLPVLCSNACGCAPDLLRDGQNGFSVDPADEEALLAAMLKLGAMDPAALRAMGQAGRALIQDWGPDLFGQNMVRAAEAALAAPTPRLGWLSGLFLKAMARAI